MAYKEKNARPLIIRICCNLYFRFGCVFMFCCLLGIVVPLFFTYKDTEENSCKLSYEYQIDCMPDISRANQTRENCIKRDCCWNRISYLEFPYCYHKLPTKEFYTLTRRFTNRYFLAKINNGSSFSRKELEINVEQWSKTHLNIQISPKTDTKQTEHLFCHKTSNQTEEPIKVVHEDKDGRLFVKVEREKSTLFDTRIGPLIFRNGYVEISSFLPSYNVYGLGQSKKRRFGIDLRTTTRWSLYSRHRNDSRENNWPGVHPFYLCMENNGKAHGVLVETIRPIEIQVTPGGLVTFRILDDHLRLHFFFGPSPAEVVSQLLECVGRPLFPPYWALGHHICYTNLTKARDDINQLRKDKVELQSVCLISEEQDNEELTALIEDLRSNKQKLLLLQNPHINYENFTTNDDYFIRNSTLNSEPFVGSFNNKSVVYPDFFNPDAVNRAIEECREKDFDGLILNYNTPLDENSDPSKCQSNDNFAPYEIQLKNLSKDTICWDSVHTNGTQHYQVHNMYGHKYLEAMWKCAKTKKKRPFIISAATFLGSGKYGGSWGGPNFATWGDLQQAIIDMLEYNMYGIPLMGAPYCGFRGEFDQALCSRWLQVSALSPLMIGYRGKDEIPVDFIRSSLISTVGKMVSRLRYSLLPYLYTLFYRAHVDKQTVVRPLFFEFPNDANTYHLNGQYMLGSALLVSAVINPNAGRITAYLPKGNWYSFYDGTPTISLGEYQSLSTIESHINLHMLGGHIIPSRDQGRFFTVTIALKQGDTGVLAEGELFVDDGESHDYAALIYMKVEAYENAINFVTWPDRNNSIDLEVSYNLRIIRLFGMVKELKGIYSSDTNIDPKDIKRYEDQFVIRNLDLDLKSNISITLDLQN